MTCRIIPTRIIFSYLVNLYLDKFIFTAYVVNCWEVFLIVQSSSYFKAALAQKQNKLQDAPPTK